MFEKIPFIHKGCAYNVIIEEDISFERLRYIIDRLNEDGAFMSDDGEVVQFSVDCEDISYSVGIEGTNIMIILK